MKDGGELAARVTAPGEGALRFLRLSARLLLQYNLQPAALEHQIGRIARHLAVDVVPAVGYQEVTLATSDGRCLVVRAPHVHLNVAVTLATLKVIDALCMGEIDRDEATRRLEAVERTAPRHGRWMVAVLFGLSAAAFARLIGADAGAIATSGVASGLGLIVRQQLARWHEAPFVSPFAAALVGGALGGAAIRLGWTAAPGLCLTVPGLMLVPGPHLINGIDEVLENHIQTGASRLGLALVIIMAAALGTVAGGWLALGSASVAAASFNAAPLTLLLDMALAGLAACGIGAAYNAPWRVLWISILCGMAGHGLRFALIGDGVGLAVATLLACAGIGLIANVAAGRLHLPFSAIAFAGAVTMMPGAYIYESIAGAMRLSAAGRGADPALAAATLALALKAAFVVGGMATGLLVGARLADLTSRRPRTAGGRRL